MTGRPTTYSPERAQAFLDRISQGATLNDACSAPKSPSRSAIYRWFHKYPGFRNSYDIARAERAQVWAEEIIDIAENTSGDLLGEPTADVYPLLCLNRMRWARNHSRVRCVGHPDNAGSEKCLVVHGRCRPRR